MRREFCGTEISHLVHHDQGRYEPERVPGPMQKTSIRVDTDDIRLLVLESALRTMAWVSLAELLVILFLVYRLLK